MPRLQTRRDKPGISTVAQRRSRTLVRHTSDDEDDSDEEEIVVSKVSNSLQMASNITRPETSLLDAEVTVRTIKPNNLHGAFVDSDVTSPSASARTSKAGSPESTDESDYRLGMSSKQDKSTLRTQITTKLFRKVKFFCVEESGQFSFETGTICGLMLEACNVNSTYAEDWWKNSRQFIGRVLTDHRNNCIKAIHRYYPGTYI